MKFGGVVKQTLWHRMSPNLFRYRWPVVPKRRAIWIQSRFYFKSCKSLKSERYGPKSENVLTNYVFYLTDQKISLKLTLWYHGSTNRGAYWSPKRQPWIFGDNFIFSRPILFKFENLDNILITFIPTFKFWRVRPMVLKGEGHFCPREAFR